MVNVQTWLDKEYPINRRSEITELDISKGEVKKWNGHERTLKGDLKLVGFTNLLTFKCSSHELTSLDVSELKYLTRLDCKNNKLNNLNVKNCPNLEIINCLGNNIRELDLSTCIKLKEVNINDCFELTKDLIKSDLIYNTIVGKLVKGPSITPAQKSYIRNILVVGMTGGGKSTLANVLVDTNEFEEKDYSVSVTENFKKSKVFEWDGRKYRIIDNIGFGDTSNLSERDILFKIGEGINSAKGGINQILFVVNGRFGPEQITAFNNFKNFVAESQITEFITIVKTGFSNFRSPEKFAKDKEKLVNESQELSEIVNSCKDFIYVDNPPLPMIDEEEDSEGERENKQKRININGKKRIESRERILNHLVKNCQEIYKLKNWNDISSKVDEYIERKKEIEQSSISPAEKEIKKDREKQLLAEQLKLRLEFSPATLRAAVEVEAKGISCTVL